MNNRLTLLNINKRSILLIYSFAFFQLIHKSFTFLRVNGFKFKSNQKIVNCQLERRV